MTKRDELNEIFKMTLISIVSLLGAIACSLFAVHYLLNVEIGYDSGYNPYSKIHNKFELIASIAIMLGFLLLSFAGFVFSAIGSFIFIPRLIRQSIDVFIPDRKFEEWWRHEDKQ